MTIDTRRAPACTASLFPLWCKGAKRSRGVSRPQEKVAIPVQQDQDQADGKAEVIVEPKTASPQSFSNAKTAFVRIACTSCPLSNWPPLLAPFPLNIWGEEQGLYK